MKINSENLKNFVFYLPLLVRPRLPLVVMEEKKGALLYDGRL